VFYEQLHADFDTEVGRLANFLGAALSPAKMGALRDRCSLGAALARGDATVRKGVVGE
jgi:hypothetical protein